MSKPYRVNWRWCLEAQRSRKSFFDSISNTRKEMAKILIKWPTRGRPELFKETFMTWRKRLSGNHEVTFLLTIDHNDGLMNNAGMMAWLNQFTDVIVGVGHSKNKIDAFNRDFDRAPEFDILIVGQDDVVPEPFAFDELVVNAMSSLYPDMDGALHFDDGFQHEVLCTQSIMGKKLFDRFGYIYHPDYISLWADNEFTDVCRRLGKMTYIPEVLLRHNWHDVQDAMRDHTESFKSKDFETYKIRKERDFPKESVFSQG